MSKPDSIRSPSSSTAPKPWSLVRFRTMTESLPCSGYPLQAIPASWLWEESSRAKSTLPEDEKDGLFLNDDNTAFVSKEVGKIAKQYAKGKEPEPGSLDSILVRADSLIKHESSIKKELKRANNELHLDTKEKIETLSEKEQAEMLKRKWISPVIEEISKIPEEVISELSSKVSTLAKKYEETLVDLSEKIETSEKDICSMLDDLVGDEFDIKGLQEFKKLLGGGKND